jgi:hypothetical protein
MILDQQLKNLNDHPLIGVHKEETKTYSQLAIQPRKLIFKLK